MASRINTCSIKYWFFVNELLEYYSVYVLPADLYCTDLYLNIISSSLQFLFLTSDYYSCILTIIDLQENTQLLSTIDIRIKIPEESALIVLTTFYTFYIHEFEQDLQERKSIFF